MPYEISIILRGNKSSRMVYFFLKLITMKSLLLFLFAILVAGSLFSQNSRHINKVTRDKTGYVKEYETTNFAFALNNGTALNVYDKKTRPVLGETQSLILGITFFYKDFFFSSEFRPVIEHFNANKKILIFSYSGDYVGLVDANVFNYALRAGYSYNFGNDFGFEPYAGFLRTNFHIFDDEIRKKADINKGNGFSAGVMLNKFFKLRGYGNYFIVYLDNSINYSGMARIHPELGNIFLSAELGVAVKFWATKRKTD